MLRCLSAGITAPIVPGIMPVSNFAQAARFSAMCGTKVPDWLGHLFEGTEDDPEIRRIKPDIYIVNEDGDKGGKREYCEKLGIEYLVLKRAPAPGLPKRTSTDLRGF